MLTLEERRTCRRFKIATEVNYCKQLDSRMGNCTASELSLKGAQLCLEERLPEGTALEVTFDLPNSLNKPKAIASVVWQRESAYLLSMFDTGLRFIQFSEEGKDILYRYLYEKLPMEFQRVWWQGL